MFSRIFSRFSLNKRARRRLDQVRGKRQQSAVRSMLDQLEPRQLLAVVSYDPGTQLLTIETDVDGESLTIQSDSNAGNYTLTTNSVFSGFSDTPNLTYTLGTLTINSTLPLDTILVKNNLANSGTSFSFADSLGNNFVNHLTVNFTNSTSGQVTVWNNATFINGKNLTLINTGNEISVNHTISTNQAGTILFNARNILLADGSITTETGNISLLADSGSYISGDFFGIYLTNYQVTSFDGSIEIRGRSGDGAANTTGVYIDNATINTINSGDINIIGNSGN
jgi:hypothetical protein